MPLNVPQRDGTQVFWDSFYSLQDETNKVKAAGSGNGEGTGELTPDLVLNVSDEDLLKRKKAWEAKSKPYTERITSKQNLNEKYYYGQSYGSIFDPQKVGEEAEGGGSMPLADNLIFQSVETFVPEITKQVCEPLVSSDETPLAEKYAKYTKDILVWKADELMLRLKMKTAARFWSLLYLGPWEIGWSAEDNDMTLEPVNTRKFLFEPTGTIDHCVYTGYYLGLRKKKTAKDLMALFPEKAEEIKEVVDENLGTECAYTEWHTNTFVFWTFQDIVLGKNRNPFFDYGSQQQQMDEFGQVSMVQIPPCNHFDKPMMPFAFLSVFSMLLQPHDCTGLVEQNLANQDRLNKFIRQVDKNTDLMNAGWGVSGDAFTEEEAANAVTALRQPDGVIWVPRGPVQNSVVKFSGQGLPADVYQQISDIREQLMGIFGVTGFSPQGVSSEETVRGKIIVRGQDQGRSSGVSEFIEQLYDQLFNWMTQLIVTRYEMEHLVPILGQEGAIEYLSLRDMGFKLLVSVKEGSLIPKDELTKRNEAFDLWSAQAIDPYTFYERIDDPDPKQSTERFLMWKMNPAGYASMFGINMMAPAPPPTAGGAEGAAIPVTESSPESAALAQGADPLTAVPIT